MELTTQQISKVSTLAKWSAKAPLAVSFALIWGVLSTLSEDSIALRLYLAGCGILLSACLWLFGQWIEMTKELQLLHIAHAKSAEKKEDLSEEAFSILCMVCNHPGEIEDSDIEDELGLAGSDLDLALAELGGLITYPEDRMDAPTGYGISIEGMRYVKERRRA